MISDKQLEANRANAQKSTGPRTEAGKQRSRLNATRHGLTAQTVVMAEEDLEAYNSMTAGIVASLEVTGPLESQLAQSYATCQWRINRIAAMEENLYTLGLIEDLAANLEIDHPQAHTAVSHAKTFLDRAREFDRLGIYGQRLTRQAAAILKQLKDIQAERRRREQSEIDPAVALYNAHRTSHAIFDPQSLGFVLTTAQIEAHIYREKLANPLFVAEMVKLGRVRAA